MTLEAYQHEHNTFLTLTYDPEKTSDETLHKFHVKKFLNRLAADRSKNKLKGYRYFYCGEYDDNERAHYHVALFGGEPCRRGGTRGDLIKRHGSCCPPCDYYAAKWKLGFIHSGTLTFESAQYIAKYVNKGMTNKNDPKVQEYLDGRLPEFARMSLKPGLGAGAIDKLADVLTSYDGCDSIAETGDRRRYKKER